MPIFLPDLPRKGLVAHWAADGDARDSAGAHHGKIGKGVSFAADRHGKARGAFLFNGRSGFITVPDQNSLDTDDAFTLSAWIKPEAYQDEAGYYPMILNKWFSSGSQGHGDYILGLVKETGRACLAVASGKAVDSITGVSAAPKGAWTHVAATFDRGRMSLYVNGRLEATKVSGNVKRTDPAEYALDDVKIGGLHHDTYNFHGAIDDVAIWNRALSAEEIRGMFAGSAPAGLALPVRPPAIEREAAADRVVLGDGQVLKGTIVNDRFVVTSTVGRFTFGAGKLAGLAGGGKPGRTWVCLNDGQVLAGAVGTATVQLKLSTGATLSISLASIRQLGWRRQGRAPTTLPRRLLTLRTGERLIWESLEQKLSFQTRFGVVELPADALAAIGSAWGRMHWVRFANGTALAGRLLVERLTFKLALGPKTSVSPGDLIGLTFPPKSIDTTDLATLVARRGDRLMGEVIDARLTVRTPFGEAALPPASVRSFIFDPKQPGKVAATQWDGVVVTGTLVERTITFRIGAGVELKVPAAEIASITRRTVLPPPEVVKKAQKLIALLGAPTYKDREEATKALIAMGKAIVPVIRPHLKSDDAEIRLRIRLILEALGVKVP